jgi:hypothetical protein
MTRVSPLSLACLPPICRFLYTRWDGEIGRRSGLKIRREKNSHLGSSPSPSTSAKPRGNQRARPCLWGLHVRGPDPIAPGADGLKLTPLCGTPHRMGNFTQSL